MVSLWIEWMDWWRRRAHLLPTLAKTAISLEPRVKPRRIHQLGGLMPKQAQKPAAEAEPKGW
jgi:hypothetical protein